MSITQRRIALLSALAVVLLAGGVVVWKGQHPPAALSQAPQAPVIGKAALHGAAPEFQVLSTNGLFDLNAESKPVFLEVFATWCPHCQRETGVLNTLYAAYKRKVAFVAVSGSDTGMDGAAPASAADVIAFREQFKVQYPVAYDGQLTVAGLYLQGGFPTFAIIDTKKAIVYLNSGEVGYSDLAAALNAVSR